MKLREFCKATGVTPSELARRVEVSRTTVYKALDDFDSINHDVKIRMLNYLVSRDANGIYKKKIYIAWSEAAGIAQPQSNDSDFDELISKIHFDLLSAQSTMDTSKITISTEEIEIILDSMMDSIINIRKSLSK